MTRSEQMQQHFTNLEELESMARSIMTRQAFDYYRSGADSQATPRLNRESYQEYRILPRILVDVSHVNTSCSFLGKKLEWPIMVAPMAMQRLADPEGELAVARACGRQSIPMIQSTMGTVPLADVCAAGKEAGLELMLFQLYVITDRKFTKKLIKDAERAGYDALVITVDAPQLGRREADERNDFKLPYGLKLENLEGLADKEGHAAKKQSNSAIAQVFASYVDPSLTWEFISWVRSVTSLPILLKGILDPRDAQLAVEAKVDGIVVSNHGGRQLDYAPATLQVLPSIVAAVKKHIPVWIDGGVRRGTDIIKCLALGADGVLLGRPVVYGLACGGEPGVDRVLSLLKQELRLGLQLMGCPSLSELGPEWLLSPHVPQNRL